MKFYWLGFLHSVVNLSLHPLVVSVLPTGIDPLPWPCMYYWLQHVHKYMQKYMSMINHNINYFINAHYIKNVKLKSYNLQNTITMRLSLIN